MCRCALNEDEEAKLKACTEAKGTIFVSRAAAVPAFKNGKPIILSTGMNNLQCI